MDKGKGKKLVVEEVAFLVKEEDKLVLRNLELEYNFYVVYSERSTGIGAFEMLIDKENGHIFPESAQT